MWVGEGNAWLTELSESTVASGVDGLVSVKTYRDQPLLPEERLMLEKAEYYGADYVLFEGPRNERPQVAQAFVYVSDGPGDPAAFAELHKRLWSWGGVPLLYRKTPGKIDLFRCAAKADFNQKTGPPKYKPYKTLEIAASIASDPWWDASRLRNGTLWDDPAICKGLLSSDRSAHRHLVRNIEALSKAVDEQAILSKPLRRRMLILSLLTAYLDERDALGDGFFGQFVDGATKFAHVLANGSALIDMLGKLEERFNGHVFELDVAQRDELRGCTELGQFAGLIEGLHDADGQGSFWRLYSFKDLPVELISNIYQLFVENKSYAVYTPPSLVRLMLEEALSWDRLDRLMATDQVICDPACGSAVFLVEAYKRLVLHWRSRNEWQRPKTADLKALLQRVHGVDLEDGAIKLAAFSLCLALCEALEPEHIRKSVKLFPVLEGETLHSGCFFEALKEQKLTRPVGVLVGNPPFTSKLNSKAAEQTAGEFETELGTKLPDNQMAYLFLHKGMDLLSEGGVLSMIQPAGFLYNFGSAQFRSDFFKRWDVREILDFVSVRGMFAKDTKIVVVVAEAKSSPEDRKVLHAVFRRSGRAEAEQGFEIDYYDMHWLPRSAHWEDLKLWRSGLLGGSRVASLLGRLAAFPTLGKFSKARNWNAGEGFIPASGNDADAPDYLLGKPLLPTDGLGANGIVGSLQTVGYEAFESPRSERRFTAPLLLVKEHMDLHHARIDDGYLTYKNEIVGFAAPVADAGLIKRVENWISDESIPLRAFVAGSSIRLFNIKATAIGLADIMTLPFPEDGKLDLSESEMIVAKDIVEFGRDLVRLGEKSKALMNPGQPALEAFNDTFLTPINGIYTENPLIAHPHQFWPGIICQPYSFGPATVDWSDTQLLTNKLDGLLRERQGSSLSVTRIARIYDGDMLYLIKPDRLRFWLRSIALRDADEVLADLRAQGY